MAEKATREVEIIAPSQILAPVESSGPLLVELQRWALAHPRPSPKIILARATEELEVLPSLAKRYFYAIPYRERKGDTNSPVTFVMGCSVKAARNLSRIYGNCYSAARWVPEAATDERESVRGLFVDFESNTLREAEVHVSRWVWRKDEGRRVHLFDDQVVKEVGIALSKAERNAVLRGMPDWLTESVFLRARAVAAHQERIEQGNDAIPKIVMGFEKLGVTRDMLEILMDKPVGDWKDDPDLGNARLLYQAILDGEVRVSDLFGAREAAVEVEKPAPAEVARRARGRVVHARERAKQPAAPTQAESPKTEAESPRTAEPARRRGKARATAAKPQEAPAAAPEPAPETAAPAAPDPEPAAQAAADPNLCVECGGPLAADEPKWRRPTGYACDGCEAEAAMASRDGEQRDLFGGRK